MRVIDLRSDTVTRPTAGMRRAMAQAEVGDDVLGDDPTVKALESRVAGMFGKEAALFVPSGTMANLLAIRCQTEPGDEIILDQHGHSYAYETAGFAAVGGASVRVTRGSRGQFDVEDLDGLVRPASIHFPRTALVIVENTSNAGGGSVWPFEQVVRVCARAAELGLRRHLDGARIWNASCASGVPLERYGEHFDTVSCCFSKGLGAPVGSALVGAGALIDRARRFRKMLGGGMRQSGVLAAGAMFALDHHLERIDEDHANARRLGEGLTRVRGIRVDVQAIESNMVFIDVEPELGSAESACARLRERGVWMIPFGPARIRAVCHLDVDEMAIQDAVERVRATLGGR